MSKSGKTNDRGKSLRCRNLKSGSSLQLILRYRIVAFSRKPTCKNNCNHRHRSRFKAS